MAAGKFLVRSKRLVRNYKRGNLEVRMARHAGRSRKPAKISAAMQHKLSLYALAAGAAGVQFLALTPPSEAEIVYTAAHVVIGRNQSIVLDINHDGISDFTIHNRFRIPSSYSMQLRIAPDHTGAVMRSIFSSAAAELAKGLVIGLGKGFWPLPQAMAARWGGYGGDDYSYGKWFNVKDGYLGLNLNIDGKVYYGWARLNVRSNRGFRIVATLTGYAYETEAGKAIIAGDTGGAADSEGIAEPMMLPQPQSQPVAALGALALGAPGLEIWRREDS